MRALSIRQPFAELILRGIKTTEFRSRRTRIIGERFLIYACRRKWKDEGDHPISGYPRMKDEKDGGSSPPDSSFIPHPSSLDAGAIVGDNLVAGSPPAWMVELAAQMRMIEPGTLLPTGVIVGSAVIARCELVSPNMYGWHLENVERAAEFRAPTGHPQPVWFNPFSE